MLDRTQLRVYFIAGSQDVKSGQLTDILEVALQSGITMFQFREKGAGSLENHEAEKYALARQLQRQCQRYNVPFIVNDDVALAIKIEADGIHVGQDDLDVASFKSDFQHKVIGLSVADMNEYKASDIASVDYIGVGPIHSTVSKHDAGQTRGYESIREIRRHDAHIPIVAIGGITVTDVEPLCRAGADGVSMISAITQSACVSSAVRAFVTAYRNV